MTTMASKWFTPGGMTETFALGDPLDADAGKSPHSLIDEQMPY